MSRAIEVADRAQRPAMDALQLPLVVVADDLSGAADSGVVFASQGYRVQLALAQGGELPSLTSGADIVCIDAHTRALSRHAAAEASFAITAACAPRGTSLFRKIDSTLRGHVAAELAAALRARRRHGPAVAVFAPAFPGLGRTVRDGHAYLHGQPLEQSETWAHERMDGAASIPTMLAEAGLRVALITLATLRGDTALQAIADAIGEHDVLAVDAELDADLVRLIDLVGQVRNRLDVDMVWTGSAGLARALAGPDASSQSRLAPPILVRPALFVIGSISKVSQRQTRILDNMTALVRIEVPAEVLLASPPDSSWTSIQNSLDDAVSARQGVLVVVTSACAPDLRQGRAISAALGQLLAPYRTRFGALVATGGETARAVLEAFGIGALRLMAEIRSGIPFAIVEGENPLTVITKAGAFGDDDALLACYAALYRGDMTEISEGAIP